MTNPLLGIDTPLRFVPAVVQAACAVTSDPISASYDAGVLTVLVAGAHKGTEAQRIAIESK